MSDLYTFDIKRKAGGKSKKTIKTKVIIKRPTLAETEDGEFFYGQKFNEFINAGFLTKAMLSKKMEDIGEGVFSKKETSQMQEIMKQNVEASRIIEFYGEAKDLDEEQTEKLENAKDDFVATQSALYQYQSQLRDQYSQTADAKAEQKLIEWFVFNFSFYEDKIDDKKGLFPIFQGENYDDKRKFYLYISDEATEIKDADLKKAKDIFQESYDTLIRVISIWFNQLGRDQKSIDKALGELFTEEEDGK